MTPFATRLLPATLAVTLGVIAAPAARAQQCNALPVVGGQGIQVTKTVSVPGLVFIRSNWDTDFEVPFNRSFTSFQATIIAEDEDNAELPVSMFLKYSDGTADEVFKGTLELQPGESQLLTGHPRIGQHPYQVNLKVGGLEATGTDYSLLVHGCR